MSNNGDILSKIIHGNKENYQCLFCQTELDTLDVIKADLNMSHRSTGKKDFGTMVQYTTYSGVEKYASLFFFYGLCDNCLQAYGDNLLIELNKKIESLDKRIGKLKNDKNYILKHILKGAAGLILLVFLIFMISYWNFDGEGYISPAIAWSIILGIIPIVIIFQWDREDKLIKLKSKSHKQIEEINNKELLNLKISDELIKKFNMKIRPKMVFPGLHSRFGNNYSFVYVFTFIDIFRNINVIRLGDYNCIPYQRSPDIKKTDLQSIKPINVKIFYRVKAIKKLRSKVENALVYNFVTRDLLS